MTLRSPHHNWNFAAEARLSYSGAHPEQRRPNYIGADGHLFDASRLTRWRWSASRNKSERTMLGAVAQRVAACAFASCTRKLNIRHTRAIIVLHITPQVAARWS